MMIKKLSLFLVSVLASTSLQAQSDYDVSLKYGLTSLDNDDGMEYKNHTISGDVSFDLGYAIRPRLDLTYINVDDSNKWGGVSSLIQGAVNAQYGQTFDMFHFPHELYLFGGLGYEYVVDGHKTFDSLPFFQGGIGAKYGLTDSLNIMAEYRGLQVFDGNNDSDDEDNEFTLFLGVNFPFGQVKAPRIQQTVELDSDFDGVNDKLDLCANTPKGLSVDASGCAVQSAPAPVLTILDSDHDGVADDVDACPNTKLTENMTLSENGCEVKILLDSDNDGVTDDIDRCENTPAGAEVDGSGCAKTVNLHINFDTSAATIKGESQEKIKAFAEYLKAASDGTTVSIEGYTDSSGNAKKNLELSRKRAFAVRRALIAAGVEKRMVRAYGKGSTNPIATNDTAEGRAENRRIEAVIAH